MKSYVESRTRRVPLKARSLETKWINTCGFCLTTAEGKQSEPRSRNPRTKDEGRALLKAQAD